MGFLKNSGYVMLSVPQSGVHPLDLLIKTSSGTVDRLNATLEELFIPQVSEMPAPGDDTILPEITGSEEFDMSVAADVGFLKSLANVFNLNGSANISYNQGKVYKIQLEAPRQNAVNIVRLSGFIKESKVNDAAGSILDNLRNNDIYVVTEIIKAKKFRVETVLNIKAEASVKAAATGIADADINANVGQKNSNVLDYEGDAFMTFAVKAYRILSTAKGLFNSARKYSLESARDVEKIREGQLHGEPLEASLPYINVAANGNR